MHNSKKQLGEWKSEIDIFLRDKLKLELHPNKSKILNLKEGIIFLGFRIYGHHKLLRKSNLKHFERKFNQLKILFNEGLISREKVVEKLEGWLAYAIHGDTYKFRKHIIRTFNQSFPFEKNNIIINYKKHLNFTKKVDESNLEFSTQKTLKMLSKGYSILKIATFRGVKENTVWDHIAELIRHKQIFLTQILSREKIKLIISKIYTKHDSLKKIKSRLSKHDISYNEIACVVVSIKSRDN